MISEIVIEGIRDTLESFSCCGIIDEASMVDTLTTNVLDDTNQQQIDVFSTFIKLNLSLLHSKLGLVVIMQNISLPMAEEVKKTEFFIPTFCETKHLHLIYDPNLYFSDEVPLVTLFTYKFICEYMYRTSM